jgi:hypothetical protein
MDTFQPFTFLAIILLLARGATADVGRTNRSANDQVMRGGIIGAIVDNSSRFGKEQIVAMEMAIMDVNDKTGQSCGLHKTTSQREPYQTVVAGMHIYVASFSQLSHTLNEHMIMILPFTYIVIACQDHPTKSRCRHVTLNIMIFQQLSC